MQRTISWSELHDGNRYVDGFLYLWSISSPSSVYLYLLVSMLLNQNHPLEVWIVFNLWSKRLRRRKDNYPQGKTDTIDSGEAGQIDTLEQTKEAHNGLMNFSQRYGFSAFALSFVAFFCAYWIYLLLWKEYLDFRTNPDFNNVGELGENLTEPYQCYNNRYIYNGDTKENEYTKCDEIFRWIFILIK